MAVERAKAFLRGDVSEVSSGLQEEMHRAAQSLEFERAQDLKERLAFCRRFGERQGFLQAFRERKLVVVEEGDPGFTYVFVRGCLVAQGNSRELGESPASRAKAAAAASGADPRVLLDRAAIVHGWLRRNAERCNHRFADADPAGRDCSRDPLSQVRR